MTQNTQEDTHTPLCHQIGTIVPIPSPGRCAKHARAWKPYLNVFLKTMSKLYCKYPSLTC